MVTTWSIVMRQLLPMTKCVAPDMVRQPGGTLTSPVRNVQSCLAWLMWLVFILMVLHSLARMRWAASFQSCLLAMFTVDWQCLTPTYGSGPHQYGGTLEAVPVMTLPGT